MIDIYQLTKYIELENLDFSYIHIDQIEDLYHIRNYYPNTELIFTFGLNYNYSWNSKSLDTLGYIPAYTTSNFYKILKNKIKKIGDYIYENSNTILSKNKFYHISVNSNLNDKILAYLTGLGSFQKNGLINIKNKGIKFIIGSLLLFEKINLSKNENKLDKYSPNCSGCNICIDKCTTKALRNGELDKNICLQHLTSLDILENIDLYINNWKNNFYGCSICVESCPYSKTNVINEELDPNKLIGYIGTSFNPTKINTLPLNNMKSLFPNNQLSARWVGDSVHLRNLILLLKYQKRNDDLLYINKELENIDINIESKNILKTILKRLL